MDENDFEKQNYHSRTQNDKDFVVEIGENYDELNLNNRSLKKVPQWINEFRHLKILSIMYNYLDSLPEQIGLLLNLEELNIGHNLIRELPKNLMNLKKLTVLKVKHNFLTEIPNEIAHLQNLTALGLESNRLKTIPVTLKFCKKLEMLKLDRNFLEEIPNNLTFLPNLKCLSICNNFLHCIPSLLFHRERIRLLLNDDDFDSIFVDFPDNCLNYISYDVVLSSAGGLDYGDWYLHGKDKKFINGIKVTDIILEVIHGSKTKHLILDRMLTKVYNMDEECFPSLKELTLRVLFYTISDDSLFAIYFREEDKPSILPSDLIDLLIKGPTARCGLCTKFIFMEAIVWVLEKTHYWEWNDPNEGSGIPFLLVVYFCSSSCANIFQELELANIENNNLLSSRLKWKKIDPRVLSRKRVRICDILERASKMPKIMN